MCGSVMQGVRSLFIELAVLRWAEGPRANYRAHPPLNYARQPKVRQLAHPALEKSVRRLQVEVPDALPMQVAEPARDVEQILEARLQGRRLDRADGVVQAADGETRERTVLLRGLL